MAEPNENLRFYAGLLRDEIRGADGKVSAAIASSSILLSANFLMLRTGETSAFGSLMILLASGAALLAVLTSILAVAPRVGPVSDALFYFRNTVRLGPDHLLENIHDRDEVDAQLARLCADLSKVILKKYQRVRVALQFLMLSAFATTAAVLARFAT